MRHSFMNLEIRKSSLASAAQDVDQLVADQLLDVSACGLQVLTGIELVGMLGIELTDGAGHCQTQVGFQGCRNSGKPDALLM